MKTLARAAWAMSLMVILGAAPVSAATVIIETAAPLEDRSEESVKIALRQAVEASIQSAMSMGIAGVRLESAVLQENRVVVRLKAFIGEPSDQVAIEEDDETSVSLVPGLTRPGRVEPAPGRIEKTGGELRL